MGDVQWDDKETVLLAVAQAGHKLRYAVPLLRADREVVLAAVAHYGTALQHASLALRADREVVLTAAARDTLALRHCSPTLRRALEEEAAELRLMAPSAIAVPMRKTFRQMLKGDGGHGIQEKKLTEAVKWLSKGHNAMRPLDYKLNYLRSRLLLTDGDIQNAFGQVEGAIAPVKPRNLETKMSLGVALEKCGDDMRARELYNEVTAGRVRELGTAHSATLQAQVNLANVLRKQGADPAEYEALYRAVVAEHNEKIADLLDSKGPSHRDTLAEKMQLAKVVGSSMGGVDDVIEAKRLYEECELGYNQEFGQHLEVAEARRLAEECHQILTQYGLN